jgi:hypothetical protein
VTSTTTTREVRTMIVPMLEVFAPSVGEFLREKPQYISDMWVAGAPPQVHAIHAESAYQLINWLQFRGHIALIEWLQFGAQIASLEIEYPEFEWPREHHSAAGPATE